MVLSENYLEPELERERQNIATKLDPTAFPASSTNVFFTKEVLGPEVGPARNPPGLGAASGVQSDSERRRAETHHAVEQTPISIM